MPDIIPASKRGFYMLNQIISRVYQYLRKRYYTYESVFQLLGAVAGVAVATTLLAMGVAALPFTGGISLLPAWLAGIIYFGVVSTTFLAAGRFVGITLDALTSKEKSNNEKLA